MKATAVIDVDGSVMRSGLADRVPWWSFSKTVLAIAALRLVERGALALDGNVPGERYSLQQLLRHEAGLADYGGLAEYHADVAAEKTPWPVDRLLAAVDADRLRYAPGAGWAYSNVGYLKVAQLIEQSSGQDLGTALAEEVFQPAGLLSARLAKQRDDLADVQMGSACGYHPGWVYHGLVVGTVADAARLLWSLTSGSLLKASTFAAMIKGRALPEHGRPGHPDPGYGLGLTLRAEHPLEHPLGHSGEGPGSKIAVYAMGGKAVGVWSALPARVEVEALAAEMLG